MATPDEQDRRPQRGPDNLRDRPGEDVGDAELAPRSVAEVVEELDPERAVQPELPLDLVNLRGRDALQPDERALGVAGQDAKEEEVQDEHEEQRARSLQQLPAQVARPAQALSSALPRLSKTTIPATTAIATIPSPTNSSGEVPPLSLPPAPPALRGCKSM